VLADLPSVQRTRTGFLERPFEEDHYCAALLQLMDCAMDKWSTASDRLRAMGILETNPLRQSYQRLFEQAGWLYAALAAHQAISFGPLHQAEDGA
jgi:hypothetical protein